jgi:hypothetical protein
MTDRKKKVRTQRRDVARSGSVRALGGLDLDLS